MARVFSPTNNKFANVEVLGFVRASMSGDLAWSSAEDVPFDTVDQEEGSLSLNTGNYRIQCAEAGDIMIHAHVWFDGSASASWSSLNVRKNGVEQITQDFLAGFGGSTSGPVTHGVPFQDEAIADDYFTIYWAAGVFTLRDSNHSMTTTSYHGACVLEATLYKSGYLDATNHALLGSY